MGRTAVIVICGIVSLIAFFPMVQASFEGDGAAVFMSILVVVAVVGNWIAARSITKRRQEEALRDATREAPRSH